MSTYPTSPLTAKDAAREAKKRESKLIADAQRKSEAYSRLVANADFKLFMEEIYKIVETNSHYPICEFQQGTLEMWREMVNELNYAHGAAKLIASFTERQLDVLHKTKVFRMEQKGK